MALGGILLRELIDLKRKGQIDGASSVMEIGSQQLSNSLLREHALQNELYGLFNRPKPELGNPIEVDRTADTENMSDQNPASREFWTSLGLQYGAIDFDGHRDSAPLDLNNDQVPESLRSRFDIVLNAGTTEHILNQDNAFRVMHDLARVGGLIIHEVPAGGMMNHGMINYNLKFFWHLCRENNYEPIKLRFDGHGKTGVPKNIVDSNIQFASADAFIPTEEVYDFMIFAVLRRTSAAPFCTPLDLPAELISRMARKNQR